MQVIAGDGPVPTAPESSAITIGAYDGVHRGHQAVIARVREMAAARGLRTVVVTFDRHPATVVRPESAPKLLCDLDQKLELLAATGIDATCVVRFDEQRAEEPAEDFVDELLVDRLGAGLVVVGDDFHFGHRRGGNVALLTEMGVSRGFDVAGVELVGPDGGVPAGPTDIVSSTRIRALLEAGDVQGANELLGRPHQVRGLVEQGDQRGRDLGFPTANISLPPELQLPAAGIYAGWFETADRIRRPTAMSLGYRPTFYDRPTDRPLLECHVLDFAGDLYGQAVRVGFVDRLRGEERFERVEDLVDQMARDVEATRSILSC